MNVILFDAIPANKLIDSMYVSARTCYSPENITQLWVEAADKSQTEKLDLIKKVFKSGHLSIAEHISFTFGINGVSRSLTHQLVRHRLCTYSQQSQRYCNFEGKQFNYVTPPAIAKNPELKVEYEQFMKTTKEFYDKLVQAEIKPEDARFVLPNAATSNIVVTTNLRNLMHVAGLRLCNRAQWEIRAVFNELQRILIDTYPFLEEYIQSNCKQFGFCPEGRSCGMMPTKKQLIENYQNNTQREQ